MKKILLLLAVLYPLFYLFDKTQQTTYFTGYHSLILASWPYLLAAAVSYVLLKRNKYYRYDELEKVRYALYLAESRRWVNTPYVAPITLMYLKNPPSSYSPHLYDYINNTFYRFVVNDFRDKVYVLSDFDTFDPEPREPYLEAVGLTSILRVIGYYGGTLLWLYYWMFISPSAFLTGWEIFSIPIIAVALYRGYVLIQVYMDQRYSVLDKLYKMNDVERKITWRNAFPDTEIGSTFVRAYYTEMERRARYDYQLRHVRVPENMEEWNNGNYAAFPYPAQQMPDWENEYELVYDQKQKDLNESSSKVIPLNLLK